MTFYHLVDTASLESILRNGLKVADTGDRSQDSEIMKTDQYLDSQRPPHVVEKGISRQQSVYAYLSPSPGMVINITNGATLPAAQLNQGGTQALIKLDADPERCYISNLDTYDLVKAQVIHQTDSQHLPQLAHTYWSQLELVSSFVLGNPSRPEVMIPYDIPPQSIQHVS